MDKQRMATAYKRLVDARVEYVETFGHLRLPECLCPDYIATLPHCEVIEPLIDAQWDWAAVTMTDEAWERIIRDIEDN